MGFATSVAMWAVGYLGRLPAVRLPSPLVLALLLLCVLGGGLVLGRYSAGGWRAGALAGAISGVLNLLVLGGLLAGVRPNTVVPSAWLWLPGSVLAAALLGGAGAAAGGLHPAPGAATRRWSGALAQVAVAAALLLLGVGGLVTSTGAGLAVVDWPNTFGYNLFLYPLSRMTGGVYYEHAHRLFGALVGLTSLVLAVQLQLTERRRGVRAFAWAIFALVVVQGVLGGLRVTGRFTLSAEADAMRPSLLLALVHGVLGQLLFAALVALAVVTSRAWREATPRTMRTASGADSLLGASLLVALLVQLVLGATRRHLALLLFAHIVVGVAVVAPLALHVGLRAWGRRRDLPLVQRLGLALVGSVAFQLVLGLGAFVATAGGEAADSAGAVLVATVHQWFGAVVLAVAVMLACWGVRGGAGTREGARTGRAGPEPAGLAPALDASVAPSRTAAARGGRR